MQTLRVRLTTIAPSSGKNCLNWGDFAVFIKIGQRVLQTIQTVTQKQKLKNKQVKGIFTNLTMSRKFLGGGESGGGVCSGRIFVLGTD